MRKKGKYNSYKKRKNIFASKLFFFLSFIFLAGLLKISLDKFGEWNWARRTLLTQEEKIREEGKRKKELERMLDYFRTEGYLIRLVKEKLNLVSPGEKVIFVMPVKEDEKEEREGEIKKKGLFEEFLQRLEGIFKQR